MLVGGREPGVLDVGTGRLAALPVRTGPGDVAELDHAGGTTTVLLRNPNRLRARAVALGGNGTAASLGQALDVLPMRDGTVLAEDCDGASGTGPCTLTGHDPTGAARWKRSVPSQLDLVRDTPYGLLVRTYQGDLGGVVRLENARSGAVYRVIGRAYAVIGADDRQVVFVPAACGSACDLTLADLDNGSSRFLAENPGNPTVAAFSLDGRRLAIGFAGMLPDDPSTSQQRGRVRRGARHRLGVRSSAAGARAEHRGSQHGAAGLVAGRPAAARGADRRRRLRPGRLLEAGRAPGHDPAGRPDRLLRHARAGRPAQLTGSRGGS
jgi:hypothetical protein